MDKRASHGKELRQLANQLKEEERRLKLEARLRQDPLDLAILLDALDVYAHQEERLRDVREEILRAIRTQPAPEVVRAFHRSSIGDYILDVPADERPRITLTDPSTQEEVDVAAEVFEELHARGAYDQELAKWAGEYFCSILDEAESCPFEYLWGYAEKVIAVDVWDLPLAVESWLLAAERAVVDGSPLRAQRAFIWAIAARTLHLWLHARPGVEFAALDPLRIRWRQLVRSVAELGNFEEIRTFLLRMRQLMMGEGQPGGFCQQFDLDLKEAVLRIEAEARRRRVPLSFEEAEPHHRESMMQLTGPDLWFRLHVKTQTFLAQADFFYQFGHMADIPHWGSVAILYFNALENEVSERVRRRWGMFFPADRRPPLPQFFDFLEAARKGALGGSHWKMLAQNVSDPETLISILPEVRSLYTRLRNPAAHSGECSRQNIEEVRQSFSAAGLCARFLGALQPLPRGGNS
ncbi:MAG: hypothetical protein HYY65_01645 [Candidatus Tectomicrobia bacterium]|uniref:Uncharacterized protein n=1 Tax=Tectimicrobiota bacterium TaxID=2528274 RepID=A0A932LZD3_UNCTE|nr:hypothetical protein [Candidatus Tectomicrobia bacterium]